jgi:DNA ligase 1
MSQVPDAAGLDGEITLGGPANLTDPDIFNRTQSAVMSQGGEPQFLYTVFDHCPHNEASLQPFDYRSANTRDVVDLIDMRFPPFGDKGTHTSHLISYLPHDEAVTLEDLIRLEQDYLSQGFEGAMIRAIKGRYKFKRSTLNENILLKLKREEFGDVQEDDAVIIGAEPLYRNDNPAQLDERGYTKRSSHKANKVPLEMLGKFICKVITGRFTGVEFKVGTGEDLTHDKRRYIWAHLDEYLENHLTFTHQLRGAKDAPRFPVLRRFRKDLDYDHNAQ